MRVVKSDSIPDRLRPGTTTTITSDWAPRVTGGHATWMKEEVESSGKEGRREMKRGKKLKRSS